MLVLISSLLSLLIVNANSQMYEDKRCRCICPSVAAILNSTSSTDRKLFIANVPPSQCNCDGVVLPRIGQEIKNNEQIYCPHCDCKYEVRNTAVIKVVVIMVIWMIALLLIYMLFLMCLYPLMHKSKPNRSVVINCEESQNLLSEIED